MKNNTLKKWLIRDGNFYHLELARLIAKETLKFCVPKEYDFADREAKEDKEFWVIAGGNKVIRNIKLKAKKWLGEKK